MIVELLSKNLGLSNNFITLLARTASRRYKTYKITRKKGNKKREISQPSKQVKLLQRELIKYLSNKLPIHETVFSYKKNVSIKDLAEYHKNNSYLMRIDFKDFFPSLTKNDVEQLLKMELPELSLSDRNLVGKIVCKDDHLTIGAPSSPFLSNALLFKLDTYWNTYSLEKDIKYSRYADDIYFSTNTPNILAYHFEEFKNYVHQQEWPRLEINHEKTVFTSKKRKRMITGLIITPQNTISVGRNKKRTIRACIHSFLKNELTEEQITSLKGYINYIKMVEPTYLITLQRKHGAKLDNLISL